MVFLGYLVLAILIAHVQSIHNADRNTDLNLNLTDLKQNIEQILAEPFDELVRIENSLKNLTILFNHAKQSIGQQLSIHGEEHAEDSVDSKIEVIRNRRVQQPLSPRNVLNERDKIPGLDENPKWMTKREEEHTHPPRTQLMETTTLSSSNASETNTSSSKPRQSSFIYLYRFKNFKGPKETLDFLNCKKEGTCCRNLIRRQKDAGSIRTHGLCVLMYNGVNCGGTSVQYSEDTADLKESTNVFVSARFC